MRATPRGVGTLPALMLVAALLVPAEAFASPPGIENVVLWHAYRGAERTALQEVIAAFHDEENARLQAAGGNVQGVQIEALAVPNEVMASKISTSLSQQSGPDVFIFAHERMGGWAESDVLAAFDVPGDSARTVIDASLSVLDVNARRAGTYNDVVYGLPLSTKSVALYWRTDMLDAPPTDTAQWAALGAKLAPQGAFAVGVQADDFYYAAPFYTGFGGAPGGALLDDAGRIDFKKPAYGAFINFLQNWQQRGYLPEEPTGAMVGRLFAEGKAATVMSGPWFMSDIDADVPYAVAPLPTVSETGLPLAPLVTVELVYVSKAAQAPNAAKRFAAFLAGARGAEIRKRVGQQIVPVQSLWDVGDASDTNEAKLVAFFEQAKLGVVMDARPEMRDVWEPANVGLKKALRQGVSPTDAQIAAQRRYEATTKAPPAQAAPGFYLVVGAFLLLLLLGVVVRGIARARAAGELRASVTAWLWVAPAMLGTLSLVIVPFVFALGLSFFSHRDGAYTFVGIGNFIEILSAKSYAVLEPLSFYYALLVTILWTGANLLLHVGVGLFLAVLLHPKTRRFRGIYRTLLIVPWAVPNYITALIWKSMFHKQLGAINGLLEALGFEGVSWFSSFPTAFFANLCANAWLGFPFMMIVALGALQSIPGDLYEAAELDGANQWQQFWRITLPLLKPAMLPAVILGTVWTFNQFNIVYLVSGGEPDSATDILISEAWRWGFARREQYGYAAAYGALIFLLLLAWSAFSSRLTKADT